MANWAPRLSVIIASMPVFNNALLNFLELLIIYFSHIFRNWIISKNPVLHLPCVYILKHKSNFYKTPALHSSPRLLPNPATVPVAPVLPLLLLVLRLHVLLQLLHPFEQLTPGLTLLAHLVLSNSPNRWFWVLLLAPTGAIEFQEKSNDNVLRQQCHVKMYMHSFVWAYPRP